MSSIRHNYSEECEASVNKLINSELTGGYCYIAMLGHFDRADIALPGTCTYFKELSDLKRKQALKLMTYQNKRGGRIVFHAITAPVRADWTSTREALEHTLVQEKQTNKMALELRAVAETQGDAHLADFLDEEFLERKVDLIKEVAVKITNTQRTGKGLGEYQFDLHSMNQ